MRADVRSAEQSSCRSGRKTKSANERNVKSLKSAARMSRRWTARRQEALSLPGLCARHRRHPHPGRHPRRHPDAPLHGGGAPLHQCRGPVYGPVRHQFLRRAGGELPRLLALPVRHAFLEPRVRRTRRHQGNHGHRHRTPLPQRV